MGVRTSGYRGVMGERDIEDKESSEGEWGVVPSG
jgi:hypothetical protein